MKKFIVYLLLGILLSSVVFPSFAQQNKNTPEQEIESLQKRVSELESKLQTVENVEKMELAAKLTEAQAKLAEANAKLINTEFDKLKLELKDSNQQWLWGLAGFIGMIVAIVVAVTGVALVFVVRSLIADRVEEHLKGFQKAFDQVNELKDELGILEKEHAVSVLDNFDPHFPVELDQHTEAIKVISEDMLLDIFSDKTRDIEIRWKAADVLLSRNSTRLIIPVITYLNNIADSDLERSTFGERFRLPSEFWGKLNGINTKETYQKLYNFLNILITENPKSKDIFLTWTVFLLVQISSELDKRDAVSMIRKTISDLDDFSFQDDDLKNLVVYFAKFEEPEGIKEIYNIHAKGKRPDVEEKCLELLEKHDPDFVKEQREEIVADINTESDENSQ